MRQFVIMGAFIVIWMCTASHCGMDVEYPLFFKNTSNKNLKYAIGRNYPDTIPMVEDIRVVTIDALSSRSIEWSGVEWKYIYESYYASDTMSLFILSCDTLAKYSWDQIREDYNILVRYDLSLKDLYKLDFRIVYPPNETMKNMKMYPPYETF